MHNKDKQALQSWHSIVQALEHIAKKYDCKLKFTHGGKVVQLFNGKGSYALSIASLKHRVCEDFIEEQLREELGCDAVKEEEQEMVITIDHRCSVVSFGCACGARLQIDKASPDSVLSAVFCHACNEQYYVRWNEGVLRRGKIS